MADGIAATNLAANLLNTIRNVSWSNASCWAELHTAPPTSAGTTGPSAVTTRYQLSFSAPSNTNATTAQMLLSVSPTAWTSTTTETITDVAVWTASTGGSFLWSAPLSVSKAWAAGDTLTLNSCTLSITPTAI